MEKRELYVMLKNGAKRSEYMESLLSLTRQCSVSLRGPPITRSTGCGPQRLRYNPARTHTHTHTHTHTIYIYIYI